MNEHYNLYYLFLEDKKKHPMTEKKNREIKGNIEKFYKKVRRKNVEKLCCSR